MPTEGNDPDCALCRESRYARHAVRQALPGRRRVSYSNLCHSLPIRSSFLLRSPFTFLLPSSILQPSFPIPPFLLCSRIRFVAPRSRLWLYICLTWQLLLDCFPHSSFPPAFVLAVRAGFGSDASGIGTGYLFHPSSLPPPRSFLRRSVPFYSLVRRALPALPLLSLQGGSGVSCGQRGTLGAVFPRLALRRRHVRLVIAAFLQRIHLA
ncbi:hypothetical protein C8J57DRAFT_1727481 [Mycena rebaudengoi]|nr:hypothetical protein C8J57DRAFT_1727481 [Mycena rebaudengoi]